MGEEITIQVKTVSEFSECQIISEIIPGFDILYLVKLNKQLYPTKILKVTTKGDWPDIRHNLAAVTLELKDGKYVSWIMYTVYW